MSFFKDSKPEIKILLLVALVIVVISVVGILLLRELSSAPTRSPEPQLPSDAVQKFVEANIQTNFWPQQYEIIKDQSELVRLGFGRRYAENYSFSWTKGDSYFLTFVGYDKTQSDQLIGYALNIYAKGTTLKGLDIARAYLNDIPQQGWVHSRPKMNDGFTSQISNILWKEGRDKKYLSILSLTYESPQSGLFAFPNEAVSELTIITFNTYKPNNWQYEQIDELPQADQVLYGQ